MRDFTPEEEKIMFHTLGYDYEPYWNDNRGGYRNYFATHTKTVDYPVILKLVESGFMEKRGEDFGMIYFFVTEKGIVYVRDLWERKKKANRPTRSKRRYEAYSEWLECYGSGSFKDYLMWLKITKEEEKLCPDEVAKVKEFKRRWNI